ncbi:hypothetical protein AB0J21_26280 [Streptomyces sp. NPDC049954]|uniref:hypothetical protein n=1 Tax=Streptomyces sp. NPDC049954 TaxID=3155779 RepID=UPI0034476670
MSRETESSSSGPQGRGAAAYPSGTPPYGSPAQGEQDEREASGAPDAGRSRADGPDGAQQPEERRTETTMTTRIRINIPGSRPIPPVVLRTPMAEQDKKEDGRPPAAEPPAERAERRPAPPAPAPAPAPTEEKPPPSDWFAPRKGGTRGGNTPSPAAPAGGNGPAAQGGSGTPAQGTPAPGGSGSFDVSRALAEGPLGATGTPGAGGPGGARGQGPVPGPGNAGGSRPGGPQGGRAPGHGPVAPSPETTAQTPLPTRPQNGGAPRDGAGAQRRPGQPGQPGQSGQPGQRGPQQPGPGEARQPGGPQQPGPRAPRRPEGAQTPPTAPWMGDDTAVLTPQNPDAAPGGQSGRTGGPIGHPDGQVSGDTLTSGIPVVPPGPVNRGPAADRVTMRQDPVVPGPQAPAGFDGPGGAARFPEPLAEPVVPVPAPAPAPKAKKKGRSKLGLLVGLVVVVAAGGYGAGLLMNRSDVPKGTTVLGVDIGGGTRDAAVNKLESTLGRRTLAPVTLDVDGKEASLKPDKSGLTLDSQATVRSAATSDYNPVSVFGSLIGRERVVQPVMPVDEEKLADSLTRLAGTSGTSREGTIKFAPGKATPVYGQAGRTLDVDKSMDVLSTAYRDQVQTGKPATVKLPLTEHQPQVPKSEVDRMMKDFAEPAMSGLVTVRAGGVSIQFGPDRSLPKILGVKAVGGKLVDTYDTKALKELYGTTFDGVLVTRGTGQKTPVTPQDVAGALRKALLGKTPAQRVGVIDTDAD